MSQFVSQSIEGKIAMVNINRPELHNAFNEVVIAELTEAFVACGQSDDVRVVVLASEGKSFCAGADINWMKRMVEYSFEENVTDANAMALMLRKIRECPKPVIARVHGACIGGGVGLAAACDIAAAVKKAFFCLSEVKLGILPAVISPFVIEKIGAGQARRYGLTAERFSAETAKQLGLVQEIFADDAGMDAWIQEIAQVLIGNGPTALALCKRTLSDVANLPWDNVQALTSRRISAQRVSEEGQDGLKSFLEKRKPNWVDPS